MRRGLLVLGLLCGLGCMGYAPDWLGVEEAPSQLPSGFRLPELAAGDGTHLQTDSRVTSGIRTSTVQYTLASGADAMAVLDRYAAALEAEGLTPERAPRRVSAKTPSGVLTAQVVNGEEGRVLTLVQVERDQNK